VSSLWTPDGERPVPPARREPDPTPAPDRGSALPTGSEPDPVDAAAVEHQVDELRRQLADAPVEIVIANHCYGLFELATVYLSQEPPLLPQARMSIDALAALIHGLEGRLGESEPHLRDGLSQLQVAFVQIESARRGGNGSPPSGSASGRPGSTATGDGSASPTGSNGG